jgi:hypothetical protein
MQQQRLRLDSNFFFFIIFDIDRSDSLNPFAAAAATVSVDRRSRS